MVVIEPRNGQLGVQRRRRHFEALSNQVLRSLIGWRKLGKDRSLVGRSVAFTYSISYLRRWINCVCIFVSERVRLLLEE